jgi:hypothetical protein
VVRSVQELATELDETSRAVTDGEYSFFAEIKDMRDKETVLSLTGGERAHTPEPPQAEVPAETESGSEVPEAREPGGADTPETDASATGKGDGADATDADATGEASSAGEAHTASGGEDQAQTERG